jgi:hypothetical protein
MSQVVSIRPEPLPNAPFASLFASAQKVAQDGARLLFLAVGWVLICGGILLVLVPFVHTLGVLLVAIGLIMVLRNSYRAKRQFIHMHRRHPKFVHPVRRLIRREPEVFPVLWQQVLRFERTVLPSRFRRAGAWRRRYFKRRSGFPPAIRSNP